MHFKGAFQGFARVGGTREKTDIQRLIRCDQVTASIVEASLQSSEMDRQEKKVGSDDSFEMIFIVL